MVISVTRVLTVCCVLAIASAAGQNAGSRLGTMQPASTDGLVPVEVNGKWGYANRSGEVVIKPQFSLAGRFSDGLALVWTGGIPLFDPVATSFVKMGYIDPTGRWVISSRWKYYFFYDFSEGLAPFRKQSGKWGYIDTAGRAAIRPRFDSAGSFVAGVAPALLKGRCVHINKKGALIDESTTVRQHNNGEQNRNGTYDVRPEVPPCS